mmetsp:Transcript_33917/g.72416  ORF Transcript_33917/g.72416 Transcript_33917/m.72416 type:complete len:322 (-) Transcript_33917:185-1150(-)
MAELAFYGAAGLIGLLALTGGVIPLVLRESSLASPRACTSHLLSLGSLFSGGLLLAAGLVHLLPDATEGLSKLGDFPFGGLFCGCGLLGMMVLEFLARDATHQTRAFKEHSRTSADGACFARLCPINVSGVRTSEDGIQVETQLDNWSEDQEHEHEQNVLIAYSRSNVAPLSAAVTFVAFAFHSFMEGLALGVSENIFEMFLAISVHKAFAAFALGTALTKAMQSSGSPIPAHAVATAILAFAALTPVGIMVGRLTTLSGAEGLLPSVLTALAAGTFLYVALAEIIAKELHATEPDAARRARKVIALLLGFGLMAALGIWL